MSRRKVDSFDLSSFLPGNGKRKAVERSELKFKEQEGREDVSAAATIDASSSVCELNSSKSAHEEPIEPISESAESVELPAPLPIEYSAVLADHKRAVSSLAMEPSGARMISGSYDFTMKFWDFNGMDRSLKSFRSIMPWDGYQIKDVKFRGKGERILVVSSSTGAKLYDRNGFLQAEYHKGDPYIRDMKKTTGHIAGLTCCQWHPNDKQLFMTAALDSTVRIWDSESFRSQKYCLVARNTASGNRLSSGVTAAAFSADGSLVFGARLDGCLSAWDWKNSYLKPKLHVGDAHEPNTETSRLAISQDGFTVVSRGGDGTMKVWDVRHFDKPVHVVRDLYNRFAETDVTFSPDEKYILTGTSEQKESGRKGQLLFFDSQSLALKKSIDFESGSVIRTLWHPVLNQIAVGDSLGNVHMYYDPAISSKGVIQSVSKATKAKASSSTYTNIDGIYTPFALPMYREGDDFNTERASRQRDKIQSHRPEPPKISMYGPGRQGKVGSGDTQTLLSLLGKNEIRDEDPREALLKYAKIAEEDPKFVAQVYKKTQPKPIFDYSKDELEEQRDVKRRK